MGSGIGASVYTSSRLIFCEGIQGSFSEQSRERPGGLTVHYNASPSTTSSQVKQTDVVHATNGMGSLLTAEDANRSIESNGLSIFYVELAGSYR